MLKENSHTSLIAEKMYQYYKTVLKGLYNTKTIVQAYYICKNPDDHQLATKQDRKFIFFAAILWSS